MSRASIALCVALMLAVASGAATLNSLSATAFSAPPGKVFDGTTGAADETTWGACTNAVFGAGANNETVYAYCYVLASTEITKVYSRALNASLLSNGTASTDLSAKIGTDAEYATAIAKVSGSAVVTATGLGNMAIAYTATDSTGCAQVYVAIFTGGTAAPTTKAITSGTCSHCDDGDSGTTGVGFVHTVQNVFYENKTYYVTYTTEKYTETSDGGSTVTCTSSTTFPVATGTGVTGQIFAYVQGTDGSALKWETVPTIYTGTSGSSVTIGSAKCGPGNSTLSVTFLCTYSTGAAQNVISYIPVTVETGVAGTAVTLTTDDAALTSGTAGTRTVYTVVGVVHSDYQHGILINKQANTYDTSNAVTAATNTLTFYNLTSDNKSTEALTGITNSVIGGAFTAQGLPFSEGWGLIDVSKSGTDAFTGYYSAWYANGTMNGTRTSFFSGNSDATSGFIDANGAFWIGTYSLTDTPAKLTTGNLGKLVAQVYAGANVLSTILSVVALFIVSIFAF